MFPFYILFFSCFPHYSSVLHSFRGLPSRVPRRHQTHVHFSATDVTHFRSPVTVFLLIFCFYACFSYFSPFLRRFRAFTCFPEALSTCFPFRQSLCDSIKFFSPLVSLFVNAAWLAGLGWGWLAAGWLAGWMTAVDLKTLCFLSVFSVFRFASSVFQHSLLIQGNAAASKPRPAACSLDVFVSSFYLRLGIPVGVKCVF